MSHPRVYISNLSFEATESQLYEFLQEYGVVSVLIPSQTVRGLKNKAVRPFGIAYAEFSTEEDAQKVIKELSGKIFMERTLNLRMHIPIDSNKPSGAKKGSESAENSPEVTDNANAEPAPGSVSVPAQAPSKGKSKRHRLRSFRRKHREENSVVVAPETTEELPENADSENQAQAQAVAPVIGSDPITEAALGVVPPVAEESATSASDSATTAAVTGESPSSSSSPGESSEAAASGEGSSANVTDDAPVRPASENVAFIGFIPRNTTDDQIRTYFKGLEPQEIIVFKNRTYRRGFTFHRHFTAALVTFPDAEKLNDAKQFVTQEKFKGKQITVKNAFLDKIEEVKQVLVKKTGTNSATENSEETTSDAAATEPVQNEDPQVVTEEPVITDAPLAEEEAETSTAQAEGETAVEVSKQSETTGTDPDANVEGEVQAPAAVPETEAPVETDAPVDAAQIDAAPVVGSAGACAQVDGQQPVEQAA